MQKTLIFGLSLALSACSFLHVHKMPIEQGNILVPSEVKRIHMGMSSDTVENILGKPVLLNTFRENDKNYVYTYKQSTEPMTVRYLRLNFRNDRVAGIETNIE